MLQHYFDLRTQAARGTDSVTADMMRHLHTRQHLGKTLVISTEPMVTLSAARKQWLRITRSIQNQRSSTLNADKILKYTHTISHMHRMDFTLRTPDERPNAYVFFRTPDNIGEVPPECFNVYINAELSEDIATWLLAQLPEDALITDYAHQTPWAQLGLRPKVELEHAVTVAWEDVAQFLTKHHIAIEALAENPSHNVAAIDDALDTLLGVGYPFLRIASTFQRALELARPLRLTKTMRSQYDALALLAHRVQALSPNSFQQRFLEVYNEDDSFFLLEFLKGLAKTAREKCTEPVQSLRASDFI